MRFLSLFRIAVSCRERYRDTDTVRHRHTNRRTDTQTRRHTDRHTDRDKDRDRNKDKDRKRAKIYLLKPW